jgi:hypothetical protein
MRRVEKYFEHLSAEIRPYIAANGGPVILVQVENEYSNVAKRYGEDGQKYLRWMVDLTAHLGLNVQIITCEGGAPGSVECVTGHSISDEIIARHQSIHPDQPKLWTELWTGWYDTWGFQHHLRDPRNIAYHLLNFITRGGSGWNYYMWHGGTNFGRTGMYLQTTSYDYDAPLDEYGRPTIKGLFLARLNQVVRANSRFFLEGERVNTISPSGIKKTIWRIGNDMLTVYVNDKEKTLKEGNVVLPSGSACIVDLKGNILFNTHSDFLSAQSTIKFPEWKTIVNSTGWKGWNEPLPLERTYDVVKNDQPIEQLSLTHDRSDYCWYSSTFNVVSNGPHKLDITYGGDFFYIYIDGELLSQSHPPFLENRGATTPEDPKHPQIGRASCRERVYRLV